MLGTGLRTLVDGVEKILLDDESDEEESEIKKTYSPIVENEAKYETNPKTYLTDPEDPNYSEWRDDFIQSIGRF